MIYKRYEISQSLSGEDIIFIARNAAGNVAFRESTEEKLKKAIDRSIMDKQAQEELEAKKRAERAKEKQQKAESVILATTEEGEEAGETVSEEKGTETETESTEPDEVLLPPQQPRVTRGPDGKFISKGLLDQEEPKKKSFWDNLK